jgi:hypothetical protein
VRTWPPNFGPDEHAHGPTAIPEAFVAEKSDVRVRQCGSSELEDSGLDDVTELPRAFCFSRQLQFLALGLSPFPESVFLFVFIHLLAGALWLPRRVGRSFCFLSIGSCL